MMDLKVWPWLLGVLLAVGLGACDDGDGDRNPTPRQPFDATAPFPDGFIWGTSTAGFQVELGCPSFDCTDPYADWTQWAFSPQIIAEGLVVGDPAADGPGHYELYASDFALAAEELHTTGFRLSLEWSRLFTQPTDGIEGYEALREAVDPEALAHYHDVLDELKARGIAPMVTINHYTMPLWIHDGVACHRKPEDCLDGVRAPGGWLDPERLIPEMAKFAGFLAAEYGDKVDLWGTLNEPYAVILPGYVIPLAEARTNPPGISATDFTYGAPVIRAMIEAHAAIYDAIHANDVGDLDGDGIPAQVGLVPNLAPQHPADPDREQDVAAAANADYLYNHLFLEALINGNWDEDLDGVTDVVRDDLAGRMDFVGINYYTNVEVIGLPGALTPQVPVLNFLPNPSLLGNSYPRGIYEVVMDVHERYGLPIYITENGVDQEEDPDVGPSFILEHLVWLRKAIHEGADVRGYYLWSLVDNYEWNHGYGMDFGIYAYDVTTKTRQPRPLADVYGAVAAANALSDALLAEYAATARAAAEAESF